MYSPLPEIGSDEYTPPELDAQELSKSADERHAEYLRIALEDTAPAASSVLKLHEREEHLIARKGHIEERDYGLAAEVLTELDEAFDKQINAFERELMQVLPNCPHSKPNLRIFPIVLRRLPLRNSFQLRMNCVRWKRILLSLIQKENLGLRWRR